MITDLTPIVLAALLVGVIPLSGCATDDGHPVSISTAYSPREGWSPEGWSDGEPAPGARIEVLLLDAGVHPGQQMVGSENGSSDQARTADGTNDTAAYLTAQRGDVLTLPEDRDEIRYMMTLDAEGQTEFRVAAAPPMHVQAQLMNGEPDPRSCEQPYYAASGQPVRLVNISASHEVELPFHVNCRERDVV
jgi:hypothetical protein